MTSYKDKEDFERAAAVIEIGGDIFKAISSWAKETSNLQPSQRAICYHVGRDILYGKTISGKQAQYAMKIYDEAVSLGFKH